MGCEGCSNAKTEGGKPMGCQSNGNCGTGGCNKLNVYNWLSGIPLSDLGKPFPILEISFKNGNRKEFFKNNLNHIFEKGEWVTVEGANGYDVGQVSLSGELVKLQMKKYGIEDNPEMKKIIRPSSERDVELYHLAKEREKEVLIRSRAIARQHNLQMKIAEVEIQTDSKKITFFYTADARVDFRELIKIYASDFKAKVEMRQIGARQESAKVGGIGSCGRELCCSTWLVDFKTVNTTAARYQNLSINQTKLSGQCGRLKCCLNYELDTYMDALESFPDKAEVLELAKGRVFLQKKDIFRNLMWYGFSGSNKQYPLTIQRVEEIKALNLEGIKPEELEAVELNATRKESSKVIDMGFVNDVGQLTLTSLSKSQRKRKKVGANVNRDKNKPNRQAATKPKGATANQESKVAEPTPKRKKYKKPNSRKPANPNTKNKEN